MDKKKLMESSQITSFLQQQPKGKQFRVICDSGCSLTDAVICEKSFSRRKPLELTKVKLQFGFSLQRDLRTTEKNWLLKGDASICKDVGNPNLKNGAKVSMAG